MAWTLVGLREFLKQKGKEKQGRGAIGHGGKKNRKKQGKNRVKGERGLSAGKKKERNRLQGKRQKKKRTEGGKLRLKLRKNRAMEKKAESYG